MAAPTDVRRELALALKHLTSDANEWPIRDRRRFRNLLLDAVTSDAMPLVELLLRTHDDGLLESLPSRQAGRAAWDAATARLVSDLQLQRFVEPGIARFVADAWAQALGAAPHVPVRPTVPRVPSSAPVVPRPGAPGAAARATAAASTARAAASVRRYRQSNALIVGMALLFTLFVILAFRDTNRRAERSASLARPDGTAPRTVVPAPSAATGATLATAAPTIPRQADSARQASDSGASPSSMAAAREPVAIAGARPRSTDDIVLTAGRVFEGRVLSVRPQSVVVKDAETGLDFEIAKADIDRIVTADGQVMRFGDDNIPLLGAGDAGTPTSNSGRYRLNYAERWGADRSECREMARRFAPGTALTVRHLRGAPMMSLEFLNGPRFNAAVRVDGLFESGPAQAPERGPANAFVSRRISGRVNRSGVMQGVARITAVTSDGNVICDVALTVRGERVP